VSPLQQPVERELGNGRRTFRKKAGKPLAFYADGLGDVICKQNKRKGP
jgi:hypothetical protein